MRRGRSRREVVEKAGNTGNKNKNTRSEGRGRRWRRAGESKQKPRTKRQCLYQSNSRRATASAVSELRCDAACAQDDTLFARCHECHQLWGCIIARSRFPAEQQCRLSPLQSVTERLCAWQRSSGILNALRGISAPHCSSPAACRLRAPRAVRIGHFVLRCAFFSKQPVSIDL